MESTILVLLPVESRSRSRRLMKLKDIRNICEGGPMLPSWEPVMSPGIPPVPPVYPPTPDPRRPPPWPPRPKPKPTPRPDTPTPRPPRKPDEYTPDTPRPLNAPEPIPWWVTEPGLWNPIIPILGIPAALEAIRRSGGQANPGLAY